MSSANDTHRRWGEEIEGTVEEERERETDGILGRDSATDLTKGLSQKCFVSQITCRICKEAAFMEMLGQ